MQPVRSPEEALTLARAILHKNRHYIVDEAIKHSPRNGSAVDPNLARSLAVRLYASEVENSCKELLTLPLGLSANSPSASPQQHGSANSAGKGTEPQQHPPSSSAIQDRKGAVSTLPYCRYCDEPWRRFCPESGRRHETREERTRRLWRIMWRQQQFISKMTNLARLEKPNTCEEEYYVEIF